jgi:NAD(P)-dependent dehydrogenase (short-subunit alcohol dehydrogenase family)
MSEQALPLDGLHAVVTGAGRGIGAAATRRLAELGAAVTLVGRTEEPLRALAFELANEHGRLFHPATADVTNEQAVQAAFDEARGVMGPVAILINNAGAVESTPFLRITETRWRALLDVNLTSAFLCAQRALPDMLEHGWGRIVNVASVAGLHGIPYVAHYVAAKHGLVGLTRSLALEVVKKGITVNAVCPGYVDTDLVSGSVEAIAEKTGRSEAELLETMIEQNPAGRLVTPDEVASTIAWLCHPDQAMVNGQAIVVGG